MVFKMKLRFHILKIQFCSPSPFHMSFERKAHALIAVLCDKQIVATCFRSVHTPHERRDREVLGSSRQC
uniref:Uncharacterized protein n=1 Tax=Anguilla anguilla TaxID=7936 RepID=A0A0E9VYV8_ANGAN